ncbi:hypothetical protein GTB64_004515 [Salmonella enterica]|nr:hypothetical protein [Salmonella enterica]
MKKPAIKNMPAPPSLEDANNLPSQLDRRAPNKLGKGDQMNFPCSPELKRQIKMFCVELGITQTEYLEKAHNFYFAAFKSGKI